MCELSWKTVCSSPNLSCTFAVGVLTQACWIPNSKHGTTSCHPLVISTSHISLETPGWKKEKRFLYPKLFRFHIDSFAQSIVSEFVVNTLGIKRTQRWRPLQYKHRGDHHYPTTESQKPNLAAQSHFLGFLIAPMPTAIQHRRYQWLALQWNKMSSSLKLFSGNIGQKAKSFLQASLL